MVNKCVAPNCDYNYESEKKKRALNLTVIMKQLVYLNFRSMLLILKNVQGGSHVCRERTGM